MKQLRMESTPSNGKTVQEWDPSFIRALKDRVDEDMAYYKKNDPSVYDLQFLQQNMFVIPVPFSMLCQLRPFGRTFRHFASGPARYLSTWNG